jgi:ribosomal protein S18 acetylase RimI-like enzyme
MPVRLPSPENLALRALGPGDRDFVARVYASTREAELAGSGLSEAQQQSMLRLQVDARERGYRAAFPDADERLVVFDERTVGYLCTRRSANEIVLIDIALLPAYRNRGIGTRLIRALLAEAATRSLPVRLNVLASHPAARLYARLGFRIVADDGVRWQMQWEEAGP